MSRRNRRGHVGYIRNTVGVTLDSPKTTAIFFDRVYSSFDQVQDAPESILATVNIQSDASGGPYVHRLIVRGIEEGALRVYPSAVRESFGATIRNNPQIVTKACSAEGLRPVLCYRGPDDFSKLFATGDYGAIVATVSGLHLIDEDRLTWEQVLALREDEASRGSIVRFFRWFNMRFQGKSRGQIEDELGFAYEEYKQGVSKFGIVLKAARSAATSLSSSEIKNVAMGAAALLAGGSYAEHEALTALAVGGFTIGGLYIRFQQTRSFLVEQNSALAFLCDIDSATPRTEWSFTGPPPEWEW